MKALLACLLLTAATPAALAQGYSYTPPVNVLGVSVSIPSIAVNGEATVSVPMPSMVPGSAAEPTSVSATEISCTTAGTALIKYVNNAGGLTANSTATTVTLNFTLFH